MCSGWKVIAVGYKNKAHALRREILGLVVQIWSSADNPVLPASLRRFPKSFEVVEPSAAGYFCSGSSEELGGGAGVEKEWIKQAVTHTHTWFMRLRPLPVQA